MAKSVGDISDALSVEISQCSVKALAVGDSYIPRLCEGSLSWLCIPRLAVIYPKARFVDDIYPEVVSFRGVRS